MYKFDSNNDSHLDQFSVDLTDAIQPASRLSLGIAAFNRQYRDAAYNACYVTGSLDSSKDMDVADALDAELIDTKPSFSLANSLSDFECKPESIGEPPDRKKVGLSELIVDSVLSSFELFHDSLGKPYALCRSSGEVFDVNGKRFLSNISQNYFKSTGRTLSKNVLKDSQGTIEGLAMYEGCTHEVHKRIVGVDDHIYIDLCNQDNQILRIDSGGWQVTGQCPQLFKRSASALPLPTPVSGGDLDLLAEQLSVSADDFKLIVGWVLVVLRGKGPYPVLSIIGEQGSSKSTVSRFVRALIDPSISPLQQLPKSNDDLFIMASNNPVLAFDNLSYLSDGMSDALCCVSTGGALTKRELYTNDEEVVMQVCKPILMNGIVNVATNADLLDRCFPVHLNSISKKKSEKELNDEFGANQAGIFGCLLDALVEGLKNEHKAVEVTEGRMVDSIQFIERCSAALGWCPGEFSKTYSRRYRDAQTQALESSPFIVCLVSFMDKRKEWEGTATQLLQRLSGQKGMSWPKSAHAASCEIRRNIKGLGILGLQFEFRHSGIRTIRIIKSASIAPNTSMSVPDNLGQSTIDESIL